MVKLKVPGTGIAYDSLDEAIADVDRMEELREVEVGDLRAAGKEAAADHAADRWDRQIQKTRDAIRGAQEREAGTTPQPAGRPKHKPSTRARTDTSSTPASDTSTRSRRGGSRRAAARKAWAGRQRRQGFLASFGRGASGRVLRETGAAGASSSVSKLVLQLFGLMVGLALVLVVIESETERRSAVGGLADFVIRFVGAIVDPVDPFSRSAWQPAAAAAVPTSASPARRPARPTIVRGSA